MQNKGKCFLAEELDALLAVPLISSRMAAFTQPVTSGMQLLIKGVIERSVTLEPVFTLCVCVCVHVCPGGVEPGLSAS